MIYSPSSDLKYYFVAFLDLLGFSNMVKSDCESPPISAGFMNRLLEVHERTLNLYGSDADLDLVQFSDSVVLATPYDKKKFSNFVRIVSKFQYNLFCQGLLCRGGIAYGKHFSSGTFLFSNGLIEAYKIEREIAKYPRVVVSTDLLELLYPNGSFDGDVPLIKQNDGVVFVDFLSNGQLNDSVPYLQSILDGAQSSSPSVKEKHSWLIEYFNYKASESDFQFPEIWEPKFSMFPF